MSAEVVGREQFESTAAQVAEDVSARARAVANATADRVVLGVRSRVRAAVQARLRAAVTKVEDAAGQRFLVGFDDAALFASGLFPMVPVWHEFGTKFKSPNPAVRDASQSERPSYVSEMEDAIGGVLEKASSR